MAANDKMWEHEKRFRIERIYASPKVSPGDTLDYLLGRMNDIPFDYKPVGSPFEFNGLLCQLMYWEKPD